MTVVIQAVPPAEVASLRDGYLDRLCEPQELYLELLLSECRAYPVQLGSDAESRTRDLAGRSSGQASPAATPCFGSSSSEVDMYTLSGCGRLKWMESGAARRISKGVNMKIASRAWLPIAAAGIALLMAVPTAGLAGTDKAPHWQKGGPLTEPVVKQKVPPVYPEEARKEKVEGVVVLEALITKEGKVGEVKVTQPAADVLNRAAIDAVSQWTYEPSRNSKGEPVAVTFTVTVRFALQ